jgi:flavin-binding protein dodecin
MSDHVYKKIEIVGSSTESIEDAANNAVKEAAKSVHNLRWMEVTEIRGHIENDELHHWQVGVKIGFTLEQQEAPETLQES